MAELEKGNRDMIQFISSLITLLAGIVLVFLGFFAVPIGVIDYTVITAFGLFLSFVSIKENGYPPGYTPSSLPG